MSVPSRSSCGPADTEWGIAANVVSSTVEAARAADGRAVMPVASVGPSGEADPGAVSVARCVIGVVVALIAIGPEVGRGDIATTIAATLTTASAPTISAAS